MKRTTAPGNISGLFTGGDPANNVPATAIKADDFNVYQEELVNVVLCAGGVLDDTGITRGQVASSVRLLARIPTDEIYVGAALFHRDVAEDYVARISYTDVRGGANYGNYYESYAPLSGLIPAGVYISSITGYGISATTAGDMVRISLNSHDVTTGAVVEIGYGTFSNGGVSTGITGVPHQTEFGKDYFLRVQVKASADSTATLFYGATIIVALVP